MNSPQQPNQPNQGQPGGFQPDERTQVVRPGQMPGEQEGPERTQMMQPGQPPQQPGGYGPPSPPGGYPQQGPPPGGFNPGSPPGGFQPGGFQPQGPPQQGGFNPQGGQGFQPGGPPQGGYQQGGFQQGPPQQQGGFGPGGGAPGFGPASSDSDKMIAWAAGGTAILMGLIVLIASLSVIGFIFDLGALSGLLLILVALLAAGMIGGGVLIFIRNKLGPLLGFACGAAIVGLEILGIIILLASVGIFSGGSILRLILVAIPTVLCFLPQTKNYVNAGGAGGPQQGFGQQGYGQQQGGYGRPF